MTLAHAASVDLAGQIARLAARFMGWVLRNRIASPLMLTVVSRAFAVPVFILGLYLVLQISGLTNLALTVLGGTGLAGIIIGFAFRDIAENFLASLLLSVRNPFRAGDVVRIGGSEGIVVNLNTRSTVLLTQEGNHVQIPNATVFKSVITNFSSNPSRRGEFSVGIGYDDRTSQAQEIVKRVLTAPPAVRTDPAPFVIVDELAAATVNLKAYFWFDSDIHSPLKLRSALMRQTKQALINGGISMPDEARDANPWLTRREILTGEAMRGRGLEIAWVDDPVELFFLQIQGSGRIRLPGGRMLRVGYGGANGHPYRSIGAELVRRGIYSAHQVSAQVIRSWVRRNPVAGAELLMHNPSYVFFREVRLATDSTGPLGAMNRPVTALRSIAVDPAFTPLGAPVWLEKDGQGKMRRLMIAQDTGSAIKGAQRADIFFGTGDAAGQAAGRLRDPGRMLVLLPIQRAYAMLPETSE